MCSKSSALALSQISQDIWEYVIFWYLLPHERCAACVCCKYFQQLFSLQESNNSFEETHSTDIEFFNKYFLRYVQAKYVTINEGRSLILTNKVLYNLKYNKSINHGTNLFKALQYYLIFFDKFRIFEKDDIQRKKILQDDGNGDSALETQLSELKHKFFQIFGTSANLIPDGSNSAVNEYNFIDDTNTNHNDEDPGISNSLYNDSNIGDYNGIDVDGNETNSWLESLDAADLIKSPNQKTGINNNSNNGGNTDNNDVVGASETKETKERKESQIENNNNNNKDENVNNFIFDYLPCIRRIKFVERRVALSHWQKIYDSLNLLKKLNIKHNGLNCQCLGHKDHTRPLRLLEQLMEDEFGIIIDENSVDFNEIDVLFDKFKFNQVLNGQNNKDINNNNNNTNNDSNYNENNEELISLFMAPILEYCDSGFNCFGHKHLYLQNCNLTNKSVTRICNAIMNRQSIIENIKLFQRRNIDENGKMIRYLNIRKLSLSHNKEIGDKSMKILIKCIVSCLPRLSKLELSCVGCQKKDDVRIPIANKSKENENKLTDKTCEIICTDFLSSVVYRTIFSHNYLTINLSNNNFLTDKGVLLLHQTLKILETKNVMTNKIKIDFTWCDSIVQANKWNKVPYFDL